jgi:hypothetical protein
VEAVQLRLICELDTADAEKLVGTVGAWLSPDAGVVADAVLLKLPQFGTASRARTRYK